MARLIGTLVIICAIVAAIGYYRGWFYMQSTSTNDQGTVHITIDKDKAAQDADSATRAIQGVDHK